MNKAASIRQRLLNLSKEQNVSFQTIIIKFFQERLLYRISISPYKNNFYLKGGVLVYLFGTEITRPTKDLDFLGSEIPNDLDEIKDIFYEIINIEVFDSTQFDPSTIVTEPIQENDKYEGVRVFIEGKLDSIQQRLQIDIGFGDIIVPKPKNFTIPTLLRENEPILFKTYTIESIIAEKLHATILLSEANSRMKDFFDIYFFLKKNNFDLLTLKKAIFKTFENRNSTFELDYDFSTLAKNEQMQKRWNQFIIRNKLNIDIDFGEIIGFIENKLKTVFKQKNS